MRHQIEVDLFPNECVARAEKVFDRVERLDDFGFEAGFLEHFAQRGRFRRFTVRDGALGKTPAAPTARGDHRHVRGAAANRDDRAAGRVLVTGL